MTLSWLNLPTAVGGAALLLSAGLAFGLVPHWQAEDAAQRQALRERARAAVPRPATPAPLPADHALVAALPAAAQAGARIAQVVRVAQQHGITLDSVRQADPQPLGQGPGRLAAEQLGLRLAGQGTLTGWQGFLAEAMHRDNALVLAQLRVAASAAAGPLSADLQWLLLQQQQPPAPQPQSPRSRP